MLLQRWKKSFQVDWSPCCGQECPRSGGAQGTARPTTWGWWVYVAWLAVQLLASNVSAATRLQVDLTQPGLRARSEAPIPVNVRFQWDGTRILEGRLDVELHEGNRVLGHYRSGEVALTSGEQRFHMLLPPCEAPYSDTQVEVSMKFITTAGDVLELDPTSLFLPTVSQRSLVMAWCNARTAMAAPDFEQTMMLEHFAPQPNETERRLSLTTLVRLAPEDLPTQPLSYTAFDTTVLTADAFSEASEGQLKALARWVKGGGSVCVFVGGGLQAHHVWFLNELESSDDNSASRFHELERNTSMLPPHPGPLPWGEGETLSRSSVGQERVAQSNAGTARREEDRVFSFQPFQADSSGNLLPGRKKISCLYSGMGRSVIITGTVGTEIPLNSPDWRRAVAFLWKFREMRAQAIAETAHWDRETNDATNAPQITIEEYAAQVQTFQRRPNRIPQITNGVAGIPPVPPGAQARMLQSIEQVVTLTDAEKEKVKAAADDYFKVLQQVRTAPISERRNKLLAARQALDTSIKGILTPEHYAKYQAMRTRRQTQVLNGGLYSIAPSYGVEPSMLASQLMAPLLPKTVRLIPFPALLGILILFLLAIGPGDYFVLGSLRRRRYTWILFPALSFCFMLATVLMANHFLGARDQRRSLTVVDLDKDGTALRWNRYDVIFAAADKQVVTELKDALWVPLSAGPMAGMPYPYNAGGMPPTPYGNAQIQRAYRARSYGEMETGPALYEGIVPTHFQTSQSIHQWQPRLNRVFSFEPPPVPLIPNWREVEAAWPDLPKVRAKLSARKRFEGDVCAISSEVPRTFHATISQGLAPGGPGGMAPPGSVTPSHQASVYDYSTMFDSDSSEILPPSILTELCLGGSAGLRSVVSQISPNGGGSCEDLPALDEDAGDSALVIVTQSGDDIIIYRRFFHGS